MSFSSRSSGSCAIACSSGAAGSKPSSRRPSVVARSKRKPSTPAAGVVRAARPSRGAAPAGDRAPACCRSRRRRRSARRRRQRAVVGRVVEAAQRQRRAERVAFAGVVEHDVEHHLDARPRAARRRSARSSSMPPGASRGSGDEQRDRVVAPVVGEAERRQVPLVDGGGDRHQLDRRDAEARRDASIAAGCASPAQVPRSASGTPGCARVKPRTCSS